MKKAKPLSLGLLLMISLLVYPVHLSQGAEAQEASSMPDWAVPGLEFVYGFALWEYFPTANVSSTISRMEQQFNIGTGNYTPNGWWDSGLFKFSLISADNQQGVFQVQGGHFTFTGYEWDGATAIWNYVWGNQTWLSNGTQISFTSIYVPPAQLSANPLVTVGGYQAYKVSDFIASTNKTTYGYYQKETGRLLYSVVFYAEGNPNDFFVMGLSVTSNQAITFGEHSLSVTSNSTVSAMAYNSTTNVLSFSASGPNGTKGYAEVTISKELCANISSMRVYIDGIETEFEYSSLDFDAGYAVFSYWIITIMYQHSTHDIQIQIPEFSSFLLLACILATVAAVGSSHLNQRKKLVEK